MIAGVGIDLVEIGRIRNLLNKFGDAFLERVFTNRERPLTPGKNGAAPHFAVRFAAKEAFLKALGTGWRKGISWRDIEVIGQDSGRPELALQGRAKEIFSQKGLKKTFLSLAHERGYGVAVVVIEN